MLGRSCQRRRLRALALYLSCACSGFSSPDSLDHGRQRKRPTIRAFSVDGDDGGIMRIDNIERVFCISDLHTDSGENMKWIEERVKNSVLNENDLIIVAGDISHIMDNIAQSLTYLLARRCHVMYLPGNHEAWLTTEELEQKMNSFDKLQNIQDLCKEMGVLTQCVHVGGDDEAHPHPLWIVPLQSWYDGSLTIDSCEDLCQDFSRWPWVDFIRCRWPTDRFPPFPDGTNAKIPTGLAKHFINQNKDILKEVASHINKSSPIDSISSHVKHAVLTASHFLPMQRALPDWKVLESEEFLRDEWLSHGAAEMSSKFAKVAGTNLLDKQIRDELRGSIHDDIPLRQMHLFGHSHRPKDFEYDGVRYIHNPLGKPRERELYMVSPDVDFQLIWDTKTGEVPGRTVIRLWEEQGGGVEALHERISKSRQRKSRYSEGSVDNLVKRSSSSAPRS